MIKCSHLSDCFSYGADIQPYSIAIPLIDDQDEDLSGAGVLAYLTHTHHIKDLFYYNYNVELFVLSLFL